MDEERKDLRLGAEQQQKQATQTGGADDDNDDGIRGGGTSPLEGSSSQKNRVPAPLASLINVEALLLARGGDVLDNPDDMVSFPFSWPRSSSDSVVPTATAVDDGEGVRSSETSTVDDDAEENQEEQKQQQQQRQPLNLLKVEEELGDWDLLVRTLRRSVDDIAAGAAGASQAAAAERVLTDALSATSLTSNG